LSRGKGVSARAVARGLPVGGKQAVNLGNVYRRQTAEDIREVVLRIDAPAAAADQDRVDDGAAPGGVRMFDEEPPFATHRGGPDSVFNQIVVDLETTVLQIPGQGFVSVSRAVSKVFNFQWFEKLNILDTAPERRVTQGPGSSFQRCQP